MIIKQEADVVTLKGANFAAIHAGSLEQLDSYKLEVPALNQTMRGKLFIRDFLGLTSMQVSMNKVPSGVSIPFYHQHNENEEVYIFVKGKGQMQIDNQTFDVEEGTIVRVSTSGSRCLRNNSEHDLYYLCIQAREHSLNFDTFEDGIRVDQPVSWPD